MLTLVEAGAGANISLTPAIAVGTAVAGGPPPLGLHILMGDEAPAKVANMIENITASRVAPVELIAEKPG